MYKVYCDNELLYSERIDAFIIHNPKLSLELNKAGTFDFTIYPKHPKFDDLKKMRSIITVYNNDELLFRGRILNVDTGWLNQKDVSCEGELAFLNDSILDSYKFNSLKVKDVLRELLENHNDQMGWIDNHSETDDIVNFKKIYLGDVVGFEDDTLDIPDGEYVYKSTWETIDELLLKKLGGYFHLSHDEGKTSLNYYKEYSDDVLNQSIEFGKNIIDFTHSANGEDIFTGILPLGANTSDGKGKINIMSENQDAPEGRRLYLLDHEKAKSFGVILKKVDFNDVTSDYEFPAKVLKARGNEHMKKAGLIAEEIELGAVDLSILNKNFDSFRIGTQVSVFDPNHGIYEVKDGVRYPRLYQVTKLDIELLSPDKNKITIGSTGQSLTEQSANTIVSQNVNIDNIHKRIDSIEGGVVDVSPLSPEQIGAIIGT